MPKLLSRERIGTPQYLAGLLLLVYIAQCAWLIGHLPAGSVSAEEFSRIEEGLAQWHGRGVAGTPTVFGGGLNSVRANDYDPNHSPLWYLIESAPLATFRVDLTSSAGKWLSRAPFVIIGALLGASLWYVSRRLYGNAGGYIALTLYCFSPAVIRSSALWFAEPNIAGSWGTFGAVFTAIAVSHTLYAPREVVLWNWRRIVLLGISLALAVGSRFGLAIIIPVLLILMLYVAAERWRAAIVILSAGCAVGVALLLSAYFFHAQLFWRSLSSAVWLDFTGRAFGMAGAWLLTLREMLASGPVLALLVPAALIAYSAWPRTRYFGNSVPLFVSLLFFMLRVAAPHESDSMFSLIAVLFWFLFVAGIAADFLETRFRELTLAVVIGLLTANALWDLIGLARIPR